MITAVVDSVAPRKPRTCLFLIAEVGSGGYIRTSDGARNRITLTSSLHDEVSIKQSVYISF